MSRPARPGSWSSARQGGATTHLLLLRHGETALTPERRFSGIGSGDPALSAVGWRQAEQAARAEALHAASPVRVLTSPLRRCRETADVLAEGLGLPVEVDEDLREMDFGVWEGLTFAEVEQRHAADLAAWRRSADAAPTGSSETFADLQRRIAAAAARMTRSFPDAAVVAVTHVTPVKAFVARALGAPPSSFFSMELSPAALTRVAFCGAEALLHSFNDTAHLR